MPMPPSLGPSARFRPLGAWAESHQHQTAALADRGQPIDLDREAGVVDRDHGLRALVDERLDVVDVHPEVIDGDDVGEDRRGAHVPDRVRRGGERDGRDDDLIARSDPGRQAGEVERGRARGDGQAVVDLDVLAANSRSNCSVRSPIVSQPPRRTFSTAASFISRTVTCCWCLRAALRRCSCSYLYFE